jgi:anti-sigma factor RsiW
MSDPSPHRLAELTVYVYGEGTPEERAAFEQHLAGCPECPADVERLKALLPLAHARLREPLDTSVDGMLRLMECAERELQDGRAERAARAVPRWTWVVAAATVVIALAVGAFLFARLPPNPGNVIYAPEPPVEDGG